VVITLNMLTPVSRRIPLLVLAAFAMLSASILSLGIIRAGDEPDGQVSPAAVAAGSAFTFQGRLDVNGVPAEGARDFRFSLFDDPAAGMKIGPTLTQSLVVTNGLFSANLDFGAGAFNGFARWLLIETRTGSEPFTALGERQALSPAPYAFFSLETAPHGHFGGHWIGSGSQWGLAVENSGGGWGLYANSNGPGALGATIYAHNSGGGVGVWTESTTADTTMVVRNSGSGQLIKGFDSAYNLRFSVASNGYTMARALELTGLPNIGPATLDISQPDALRNLIYADVAGATRFTVSAAGNVSAKGSFIANQFDLAEHISASGTPPGPGDVVEIDPGAEDGFRLSSSANSPLVAGVISTAPGFVLGSGSIDNPATTPQLALAGRVPVKVTGENGPVEPGDLLVSSSTPGHAMKAPDDPDAGTVIGKSLGTFSGEGAGSVTMLIMLR